MIVLPEEKKFVPWYMKPDVVEGYEGWYEGKYRRADVLEKRVISDMISQFPEPKTILEIGCGTSHFTRWFDSLGLVASGVDLSPLMVRQAKKIWPMGNLINAKLIERQGVGPGSYYILL